MENNQKPEWFELADNDQPTSRPLKKKSAPIRSLTYILAGALVIPMGAGFALLTHEDQSATAVETLNFTQDSPAAISPTQALPENTIAMPVASREDDDEEEEGDDDYRAPVFSSTASTAPVSVAPITAPAIQNSLAAAKKVTATKAPVAITPPGSASNEIILPPTKKAGDDDEEEDDDDHNNKKSKKSKDSDDDEDEDDD